MFLLNPEKSFKELNSSQSLRLGECSNKSAEELIINKATYFIPRIFAIEISDLETFQFQIEQFAQDTVRNCRYFRITEIDLMFLEFAKAKNIYRIDLNTLFSMRDRYIKKRREELSKLSKENQSKDESLYSSKDAITAEQFCQLLSAMFLIEYYALFR